MPSRSSRAPGGQSRTAQRQAASSCHILSTCPWAGNKPSKSANNYPHTCGRRSLTSCFDGLPRTRKIAARNELRTDRRSREFAGLPAALDRDQFSVTFVSDRVTDPHPNWSSSECPSRTLPRPCPALQCSTSPASVPGRPACVSSPIGAPMSSRSTRFWRTPRANSRAVHATARISRTCTVTSGR